MILQIAFTSLRFLLVFFCIIYWTIQFLDNGVHLLTNFLYIYTSSFFLLSPFSSLSSSFSTCIQSPPPTLRRKGRSPPPVSPHTPAQENLQIHFQLHHLLRRRLQQIPCLIYIQNVQPARPPNRQPPNRHRCQKPLDPAHRIRLRYRKGYVQ